MQELAQHLGGFTLEGTPGHKGILSNGNSGGKLRAAFPPGTDPGALCSPTPSVAGFNPCWWIWASLGGSEPGEHSSLWLQPIWGEFPELRVCPGIACARTNPQALGKSFGTIGVLSVGDFGSQEVEKRDPE